MSEILSLSREKTLRCCLSTIGIILSVYSIYVEITKSSNDDYEAFCDISSYISCSKVFTSEYGTGFGLLHHIVGKDSIFNCPNSIYGILFYTLQLFGLLWNTRFYNHILLWSSVFSVCMCFYLGYILAFVLYDFCVVCVSTYVVNALLMFLNVCRSKMSVDSKRKLKRKKKVN